MINLSCCCFYISDYRRCYSVNSPSVASHPSFSPPRCHLCGSTREPSTLVLLREAHHRESLYNYRQYSKNLLCYMMANPSDGIRFLLENLRQGHRYIKTGKTLFPCPPSADISDLPLDQEIITVLSKQMGRIILEHDFSFVTKSGHGVRPAEAEAMRLVSQHTSVPVPEVFFTNFDPEYGDIEMTLIMGSPLEDRWDTLDEKSRESVCRQVWGLISSIRTIPRPSKLKDLFQCAADGSVTRDPMLEDLEDPARPLKSDSDLRARILERYLYFGGRRYKHQLHNTLPQSDSTVFTHADIAPRNIMIDDQNKVTGILDWESAGWYPDYWEYAQILRPAYWSDWSVWMDRTAPQRWDITGINAARRILF